MTHPHAPLEQLMTQAQTGDTKAYHALLTACLPLIHKIVRAKISDTDLHEDIVQEILISIHRAKHTYDTTQPFKPWLYAICRFRITDALRTLYKTKDNVATEDLTLELPDIHPSVTKQVEDNELIRKMMATLPEKQRNILLLMKMEGRSAAEVALAMRMSVSAVKVSAHRAIKALKERWEVEHAE